MNLRRRTADESGIALVMALGIVVVLAIATVSVISYATSGLHASRLDQSGLQASAYAESALQATYSLLSRQNTTGGNPAAANLLGCSGAAGPTDTSGPSNCTTPAPLVVCVAVPAPCAAGTPGTATIVGFFSGTNPSSYAGVAVPSSTWLIAAVGYARNETRAAGVTKSARATVKISPLDAGAVASVWNHIFITAPLVPNQCQIDFGGNGITVNVPIYVIGNLCLSGQNVSVQENTAGQPIDLQVGGKLVLSGSGSKVGTDLLHPITSGVVVGGCTVVGVTAGGIPCSSGFNYWVKTPDQFVPNDAPSLNAAQMATNYASFDPGPRHTCLAGVISPGPPLADSVFDNLSLVSGEPDTSGSVVAGGAFELAPATSYSCISKNGAAVGQLTWNASTRQLTVNGSIFVDGNMTISQSLTYTGAAVIEVAGIVTVNGNATSICATGPPCDFTSWQGGSANRSMLTLAPLAQNTNAITFTNNNQTFQGSLWTQPSSAMTFQKNGVAIEGPVSVGRFDSSFNNAQIKALPTIVNMPVGAPIPPNTSASLGPLVRTG